MTNLIPLNEYAAQIGKAPVSVRQKCQRGNVPGAAPVPFFLQNRTQQNIPTSAFHPDDM